MLEKLRNLHDELRSLKKDVNSETKDRISKKGLRDTAERLGASWFAEFSEQLVNTKGIPPESVEKYSSLFGRLIKISAPNNLKSSYLDVLGSLTKSFRADFILPLQTQPKETTNTSLLGELLKDVSNQEESEYLAEAVACARHKFLRASAGLGWCAVIDRIHRTIEKEGFLKFNVTSAKMASETKGRFKKFNQVQNVGSISELREVFDNIILWILEGMELIDSNQHTRLRSCFELRCQCAHPGDAPVTEYNLLSYYSDLNEIVFKNPKFSPK
jgi:hypothetical protein